MWCLKTTEGMQVKNNFFQCICFYFPLKRLQQMTHTLWAVGCIIKCFLNIYSPWMLELYCGEKQQPGPTFSCLKRRVSPSGFNILYGRTSLRSRNHLRSKTDAYTSLTWKLWGFSAPPVGDILFDWFLWGHSTICHPQWELNKGLKSKTSMGVALERRSSLLEGKRSRLYCHNTHESLILLLVESHYG